MSALATITVGVLSKMSGVKLETIRSYERMGLLPGARKAAGYLLYRTEDVERMTFIRRAVGLGFPLDAVRSMLGMDEARPRSCRDVYAIAARHLADIRRRQEELARMEKALAPLVSACSQKGGAADCPIVNALSHPVA